MKEMERCAPVVWSYYNRRKRHKIIKEKKLHVVYGSFTEDLKNILSLVSKGNSIRLIGYGLSTC